MPSLYRCSRRAAKRQDIIVKSMHVSLINLFKVTLNRLSDVLRSICGVFVTCFFTICYLLVSLAWLRQIHPLEFEHFEDVMRVVSKTHANNNQSRGT